MRLSRMFRGAASEAIEIIIAYTIHIQTNTIMKRIYCIPIFK